MSCKKYMLANALFCASLLISTSVFADSGVSSDNGVTIGILDDMTGPYKAAGGPGAVVAARMAISDFGGSVLGRPIKLLSANHQNKPDLASSIARKWIDENHATMIAGLDNSAAALAVQGLASAKQVITMDMGASAMAISNENCTKFGIQYLYNTHSLAAGTASAVVKQGGKKWFFITVDYAFGHSLQDSTAKIVKRLNGQILGSVDAPLGTNDFSSYLLTAQTSGAQVIGLANAGKDFVNAIRQAHEFNIKQQLVGLLVFITDVKALGLHTAQGLEFSTSFLWNRTPESKAWSKRFFSIHKAMPTMNQAGVYSAVIEYLRAVKEAGTSDGPAVRAQLGKMSLNDMFVHDGHIRPNGTVVHDMYLVRVKNPSESDEPWDLLKVVRTVPADEAFRPLSASSCPLVSS